jgi:thioredoxin-related protein
MRLPRFMLAVLAAGALALPSSAAEPPKEPAMGDNGLYVQPWFLQSFLVLREDLQEAAAQGKRFAIFWEQKGCPYCKETHLVNLAKPEVSAYIRKNFAVLQLDLWGARKVTDFDGEVLSEKALARKYAIRFTPTVQFFPPTIGAARKSGKELEVARLAGYMRPFPFLMMFHYVKDDAYATASFRVFFKKKLEEESAKGGTAHTW